MVVKETRPLPQKVEKRLSDLKRMGEFEDWEIELCRKQYWDDRDGWHTILISCYDRAIARTSK